MKILRNSEQDDLRKIFPFLWYDDIDADQNRPKEQRTYKRGLISLFDHILTDVEASQEILFYQQAIKSGEDSRLFHKYLNYEQRYLALYESLYKRYRLFHFGFPDNFDVANSPETSEAMAFFAYESITEFLETCTASLRERPKMVDGEYQGIEFLSLAMPEIEVLLLGNYDLTAIAYFKNDISMLALKKEIERNGLYLIQSLS